MDLQSHELHVHTHISETEHVRICIRQCVCVCVCVCVCLYVCVCDLLDTALREMDWLHFTAHCLHPSHRRENMGAANQPATRSCSHLLVSPPSFCLLSYSLFSPSLLINLFFSHSVPIFIPQYLSSLCLLHLLLPSLPNPLYSSLPSLFISYTPKRHSRVCHCLYHSSLSFWLTYKWCVFG